jgi:hypothetical protein
MDERWLQKVRKKVDTTFRDEAEENEWKVQGKAKEPIGPKDLKRFIECLEGYGH